MKKDSAASHRFMLIFATVFTLACIVFHRIFETSFQLAPGASVISIPIILFINILNLAVPAGLLSLVIYHFIPKRGDRK